MRWIGWTLAALPGLAAGAAACGYWVERTERERLGRRYEIYPLEGGRVRLEAKPDWGAAEAVVVDPESHRPLSDAEAAKFSWRGDEIGPLEWPEAGVLKLSHQGRPFDLIYTAPPDFRAALRVHPFGIPRPSRASSPTSAASRSPRRSGSSGAGWLSAWASGSGGASRTR